MCLSTCAVRCLSLSLFIYLCLAYSSAGFSLVADKISYTAMHTRQMDGNPLQHPVAGNRFVTLICHQENGCTWKWMNGGEAFSTIGIASGSLADIRFDVDRWLAQIGTVKTFPAAFLGAAKHFLAIEQCGVMHSICCTGCAAALVSRLVSSIVRWVILHTFDFCYNVCCPFRSILRC